MDIEHPHFFNIFPERFNEMGGESAVFQHGLRQLDNHTRFKVGTCLCVVLTCLFLFILFYIFVICKMLTRNGFEYTNN